MISSLTTVKMKHFQIKWKSSDGLDIFAQGWNQESGDVKAVICLVHGIGEHTLRYQHIAEALTEEGLALFGADLRGHGNSGGIRGHFLSIEAVIRDFDQLLEHARDLYPGKPLFLYGHSLGGLLVLYYSIKEKPSINGVISTGPALHNAIEKQKIKVMAARILGALLPTLSIASGLDTNALCHNPEVVKAYENDSLTHDRFTFGFGKSMLGIGQWTLEHAKEFSLPLLLMHGRDDSICDPSGSIEFAAAVKEKCTLVLWDNAFHELHNEPIKKDVFKTITAWIGKQIA